MTTEKLSISLSPELASVLRLVARQRKDDLSRLIEVLLRESPLVQSSIRRLREPQLGSPLKKGRTMDKLRVLGRTVDALWEQRLASGKVRQVGRDA